VHGSYAVADVKSRKFTLDIAAASSREPKTLAFFRRPGHKIVMRRDFDPEDYALVAKLRANPPNPWKWEIYCAGKRLPIEQSKTPFASRGAAHAEGKQALRQLLDRLSV
jgi:hypothetical protein